MEVLLPCTFEVFCNNNTQFVGSEARSVMEDLRVRQERRAGLVTRLWGSWKVFQRHWGCLSSTKSPLLRTCSFLALYEMPKKENEMTQTLSVHYCVGK